MTIEILDWIMYVVFVIIIYILSPSDFKKWVALLCYSFTWFLQSSTVRFSGSIHGLMIFFRFSI